MKPGDQVFLSIFLIDDRNKLEKTEVIEGKILNILSDEEVEVEISLPEGKQKTIQPLKNLLLSKEDAEKKIYSALAWKQRKELKEKLKNNINFLPEMISKTNNCYASCNPLRYGEPNIFFGAQSNTWGQQDNAQKILQIIGAIWEDIEILNNVLYVLGFANDYSKKLVGKYIIIELNSLYKCLTKLCEFDEEYKSNFFQSLEIEILQLEKQFNFKGIRDKIGAHRDTNLDLLTNLEFWRSITRYSIQKYIEIFSKHIDILISKYPDEALILKMRKKALLGRSQINKFDNNPYKNFDDDFGED